MEGAAILMYNYNPFNSSCIKEYKNMNKASKPYNAPNMIVQKSEVPGINENINNNIPPTQDNNQIEEAPAVTPPANEETPVTETPIIEETPAEIIPIVEETPISQIEDDIKTGYLSVGVFTALQALPVPDAVVTIYLFNSDDEEEALYILVTDENGRIPDIELPVFYNPDDPFSSSEYYFTQYNLRVQAINYYTVNILDVRVFPDITTVYKIDLIPVMAGTTRESEQTIVIPPSPIDESNE
jgi:5-hydroxyisourate hydrolase-like protein (transthyretin family)